MKHLLRSPFPPLRKALAAGLLGLGLGAAGGAMAQTADLIVNKSAPLTVNNGDVIRYDITISNNGPDAADGATFEDILPNRLGVLSATCGNEQGGAVCPAAVSVSGQTVADAIPSLPSGGSVDITIHAQTPTIGASSYDNTVKVEPPAGVSEGDPSTNSSTVSTGVTVLPAALTVTKTALVNGVTASSFNLGDRIRYEVTLHNAGPGAADGVLLRDRMTSQYPSFNQPQLGLRNIQVSCTANGGAECPVLNPPVDPASTYVFFPFRSCPLAVP